MPNPWFLPRRFVRCSWWLSCFAFLKHSYSQGSCITIALTNQRGTFTSSKVHGLSTSVRRVQSDNGIFYTPSPVSSCRWSLMRDCLRYAFVLLRRFHQEPHLVCSPRAISSSFALRSPMWLTFVSSSSLSTSPFSISPSQRTPCCAPLN